MIGSLTGAVTS